MGSVLPSSFSWGFNPKLEEKPTEENEQLQQTEEPRINEEILGTLQSTISCPHKSKRRFQDEDDSEYSYSPRKSSTKKSFDKFRVSKKEISQKRIRPQIPKIIGQPLPTDRIIEVLDKQNLQELLNNLIQLHPEITQDIYKCAPEIKISETIDILSAKVDKILSSLPYRVDTSSEYAYLRVQPLIEDFLNALSDFTLHYLPPVEMKPLNSLMFLDQATSLLHKLPMFSKLSNNYFKDLAYEQLSHTWCDSLKEFIKNSNNSGLLMLINNNWEYKIKTHNELSNGKLSQVLDYFKDEISSIEDLDSSRKFSNLHNFSPNNSPLHSLKSNLLDGSFR
ncbi:hypothetical protein WICMUC_002827 [Wickerhamomyces mucosus]|uniref:Tethering factor for nuclear proteasome STS1 n=1 Tax=Wickerhamomyces mucosus TaxID=1378264 RepID=A0A9P8TEA1_9ASCO|nr:hypothetical protein WICMUC_002827 [Wickerhamomyces mucosus]